MLCLKKRRTYSFTQGACKDLPRRSTKEKNGYNEALNMAVTTLPRKHRSGEERSSAGGGMVLTVTEDTPADMLAGSMELVVQLPRDHHVHTQRVTVPRSTPMMDLLVQIATAHKLAASSYTLQAIGERGLVLPHQPNTPIGALDALQVKLLPKQGAFVPRKAKQANQPFETTFRLQVLLPRNQLYVSRVSPKMNLGKILEEVCREKNLDKNKYELRHPANLEETLDLSLSLQDYRLQEVTLYAKQGRTLGAALSSQDIMALQRQEERRRQQAKQSVFGFMFRKSKESSLSIDSLGGRSVSPARSDGTGRSVSPLAPPARPQRKRRPAPKPPVRTSVAPPEANGDESKEKLVISHSRNSSDSSGYHEASVLSDNPDSNARMPETLPRRGKPPCKLETGRKLAQTSQASKSLGNLAVASGGLAHGISSTSISSTGVRKKRAAPPPPIARPLSSAISTQALERIVDSEESLTSDIDISKSPSDIAASSKANSDIGVDSKANSDIGVHSLSSKPSSEIGYKIDSEFRAALAGHEDQTTDTERRVAPAPPPARSKPSLDSQADAPPPEATVASPVEEPKTVETARVAKRAPGVPIPKPRSAGSSLRPCEPQLPVATRRKFLEHSISDDATFRSPRPSDDERNKQIDSVEYSEAIDSHLSTDVRVEKDEEDPEREASGEDSRIEKTRAAAPVKAKSLERPGLKHAKSMDDIYSLSIELSEDPDENNSLTTGLSCAVISTIPKCAHLTPKPDDASETREAHPVKLKRPARSNLDKADESPSDSQGLELSNLRLEALKRSKVFRSQSATNDFDVNSFAKSPRLLTLHPESFACALNPNFSRGVASHETGGPRYARPVAEVKRSEESHSDEAEAYPPFVVHGTNWRGREDFAEGDSWPPQLIEQSASGDRTTTETDILLQKVSDTLSNSLPSSESLPLPPPPPSPPPLASKPSNESEALAAVPKKKPSGVSCRGDESDGPLEQQHREIPAEPSAADPTPGSEFWEKLAIKNRESLLSEKNVADASTPNATLNSQQDTSDYVSAMGDDLSITDWEYQLPAPPSAFRDNISPDLDGYDTITLRSVEAFNEPVQSATESPEVPQAATLDSSLGASPIPPPASEELREPPISALAPKTEAEQPTEMMALPSPREIPKLAAQTSTESRSSEASLELKKEIINELANKIENGSLHQSNARTADQELRRASADFAAPKIAPVDNTLSNFTITTYSRQKSLNIFEESTAEEKRGVSQLGDSEDKVVKTFASLSMSKTSVSNGGGNSSSRNPLERSEDELSSQRKLVASRAQSVEHIAASEAELRRPELKFHFAPHDSLLRRQSMSNGHEKSSVVHRSKSHIALANNSKYREDANGESRAASSRDEPDDSRIVKSTSVTSLNQETQRSNDKFSQWRENILKRQEEPSKEKQLQSLQVLKSILPQLKSTQQTEENVLDSSHEKEHSHDTRSKILPEADPAETKSNAATEAEVKPLKTASEVTTKRYKYAGPPAISLGSWSERPRVNVQLKMDTDYKFGASNISGPKTVVNLNRASGDENNAQPKDNLAKALPKTGTSPCNGTTTHRESQDSEDPQPKTTTNHAVAPASKKPPLTRVGFAESKNFLRVDDKPIVTSVALKKTPIEKTDRRENDQQRPQNDDSEDDVKIDTKPVNFRELTKTFGQEVCLRPKAKRVLQNRHSDYYGTRPDHVQSFSSNRTNGQTNLGLENASKNASRSSSDSTKNPAVSNGTDRDASHAPIKRYTSFVGIQSHPNNQPGAENGDSTGKSHSAMKINGLIPVVKGFKIQTDQRESKSATYASKTHNGAPVVDVSRKNASVPPAPPTMPIITGVTLKTSTARPKSMPINVDTRDQLLESIRSFGGRDKLRSVVS